MATKSPFLKLILAGSCTLILALPVGAGEFDSFLGDGTRYVAADGTHSRRIDLTDPDDRSLLTSLILEREGRVYAFERRPAVLKGSGKPLMQPDVFDLGQAGHSNRLTAAISDGRSVFYVPGPATAWPSQRLLLPQRRATRSNHRVYRRATTQAMGA